MKISVKTMKGNKFEIEVNLQDTIGDVKTNIENVQGQDVYPAARQMLFYQGQILKDGTLEENKVSENGFIFIMLSKVAEKTTAPPPTPVAAPPPTTVKPLILDPNLDVDSVIRDLLAIRNNPEISVEHLNSGIPEPPEVPPRVAAPPPPPVAGFQPGNPLPRGPVYSFTPEEMKAIERLVAMGFDRSVVTGIFFAYNKNEEMAANYLLNHMDEFQ